MAESGVTEGGKNTASFLFREWKKATQTRNLKLMKKQRFLKLSQKFLEEKEQLLEEKDVDNISSL